MIDCDNIRPADDWISRAYQVWLRADQPYSCIKIGPRTQSGSKWGF